MVGYAKRYDTPNASKAFSLPETTVLDWMIQDQNGELKDDQPLGERFLI